ncbi:MAG TPA: EamA family transporter [Candidatus Limnocylindrales bacterium]
MSLLVFGLLVVSAVMHAAWNVLLKTAGDPLRTSARAVVTGTLVAVPLAAVGWLATGRPAIPAEGIGLAVASGLGEAVYFVCLSAAYRRGDLSLVYPIARGTAPLLAVASGVLLLGERLGPLGSAGVVALLAGLLAVRRPWDALASPARSGSGGRLDAADPVASRRRREAVLLALATGVMIATYSSLDRVGSRLVVPWLYVTLLWVVTSVALLGWIRLVESGPAGPPTIPGDVAEPVPALGTPTLGGAGDGAAASALVATPRAADWPRSVAIGLLLLAAYLLVLVAFTLAPLSAVAPLRESAVVFASGWGALRLGEASGRRDAAWRVGGAALIVVGAVLLAFER